MGPAIAPWNKGDAGAKLVLPHVLEQLVIVKATVTFPQQRIVNNEAGLGIFVAPGAIAEQITKAGEPGGDGCKAGEHRSVTRANIDFWRLGISEQNEFGALVSQRDEKGFS